MAEKRFIRWQAPKAEMQSSSISIDCAHLLKTRPYFTQRRIYIQFGCVTVDCSGGTRKGPLSERNWKSVDLRNANGFPLRSRLGAWIPSIDSITMSCTSLIVFHRLQDCNEETLQSQVFKDHNYSFNVQRSVNYLTLWYLAKYARRFRNWKVSRCA